MWSDLDLEPVAAAVVGDVSKNINGCCESDFNQIFA